MWHWSQLSYKITYRERLLITLNKSTSVKRAIEVTNPVTWFNPRALQYKSLGRTSRESCDISCYYYSATRKPTPLLADAQLWHCSLCARSKMTSKRWAPSPNCKCTQPGGGLVWIVHSSQFVNVGVTGFQSTAQCRQKPDAIITTVTIWEETTLRQHLVQMNSRPRKLLHHRSPHRKPDAFLVPRQQYYMMHVSI